MLKGINPLLTPELLHILRAMGHGDDIAIVDANFPADSCGPQVVRLDGIPATAVLDAILSVMPLDPFVDEPAIHMEPVPGEAEPNQPIFDEFRTILGRHEPGMKLASLERFKFYEATTRAYAVIATGERRFYGNIILKKGVVAPD